MIFLDDDTRCVVQGITGKQGSFHTRSMLEYNTNIVAGTSPGKGGQEFEGIPVYNSIAEIKEDWFVGPPLSPTDPEDLTEVDWDTSWRRIKCRSEAHAEHILSLLESGTFDPEDSAISLISI